MNSIVPLCKFFVYTLTNSLDGQVFYVGKAHSPKRMSFHEWEAKRSVQSYKCRKIRKIWRMGGTVIKTKVAEFDVEQDAFVYEWVLINLIYKRENLTNMSEGGEGVSGHSPHRGRKHSEQFAKDVSVRSKKMWADPEYREKMRAIQSTPEYRAKMKAAHARRNPEANARVYTGLVDPFGQVFSPVHNIAQFARKHHLNKSALHLVATGKNLIIGAGRNIKAKDMRRKAGHGQCCSAQGSTR